MWSGEKEEKEGLRKREGAHANDADLRIQIGWNASAVRRHRGGHSRRPVHQEQGASAVDRHARNKQE